MWVKLVSASQMGMTSCHKVSLSRFVHTGELMTMAKWMREFVAKHPEYKQDSVITDKINYDLLKKCDRIARGEERCPELVGEPINRGR